MVAVERGVKGELWGWGLDHAGQLGEARVASGLIAHNVFINWFERVNFPTKFVNLLFTNTNQNIELTVLWGGVTFQN